MNNEMTLKMFIDGLFFEVELAIMRAREIQERSRKGGIKRDAEFIEQTLMRVAQDLADHGQRAKQRFESLRRSN